MVDQNANRLKGDLLRVAVDLERSILASLGPGKGSLSARDPRNGHIIITPSGKRFSDLEIADVVDVEPSGRILASEPKPSLDLVFHLAIYAARADVGAIVHSHSPHATAWACLGQPIEPLTLSLGLMVGGSVEVAPFAFPGTSELGERVVRALGHKSAVLMESHGVIAVGQTPDRALACASTVENAAQIQALAFSLGNPRRLDDATIARVRKLEAQYGQVHGTKDGASASGTAK